MLFNRKMHLNPLLTALLLCSGTYAFAQDVTVQVKDAQQQMLPQANIWVNGKLQGRTDSEGSLVFARPKIKNLEIRISHSGYPDRIHRAISDLLTLA
ncbi:peptidase associated/transthyretin-like domain-containing protein [Sphingobacterium bambusae]|uniref:TonB-dependent receptor n=1 Tax=Sphingobacterium bambusae TaxID=662858 RepID=A0ABW6BP60_9SPHI|nr:hypothetical protein [Sphingobacterium bambusae]WPL48209.1 hypothetical protein SCB77_19845 [Sphingobacterium bambusae]